MPSRYYKRNFVKGYYYHIFNRGSHKNDVFLDPGDYETFLEIVDYYLKFPQGKPLSWKSRYKTKNFTPDIKTNIKVRNLDITRSSFTINCFCLMPNHFHLLLKQKSGSKKENDIVNFMRRLMITYAMYFIEKYKHSGNLFQGKYKNVLVENDSQLLYLTKYIHQNPSERLTNDQALSEYKYSSYPFYLGLENKYQWIDKNDILKLILSDNQNLTQKYQEFVENKPQKESLIEKVTLESEN